MISHCVQQSNTPSTTQQHTNTHLPQSATEQYLPLYAHTHLPLPVQAIEHYPSTIAGSTRLHCMQQNSTCLLLKAIERNPSIIACNIPTLVYPYMQQRRTHLAMSAKNRAWRRAPTRFSTAVRIPRAASSALATIDLRENGTVIQGCKRCLDTSNIS